MTRTLTKADEGKAVVTADGHPVGTVHRVGDRRAHVLPDDDAGAPVRERLGWTAPDGQVWELPVDAVAETTDDEVRLELRF